jgi:acyl carrier protein
LIVTTGEKRTTVNRIQIQEGITQILQDIARTEAITSDSHLHKDLGIDSLDLLVVRESLERSFDIFVADEEAARLDTVSRITDLVQQKLSANGHAGTPHSGTVPRRQVFGGRFLGADDELHADMELGMHLTGRNNLAETPLLREIGNLRWEHMSLIAGVPSKEVVDESGERLYPTFFFVEIAFPPLRPMASYCENDRLTVVSTLRRFGLSMLDGEHYLFPAHWPSERKVPFGTPEQALQAGVPFIRLSNSFVKQWRGAEWLKRSRPVNSGFTHIRGMAEAPTSYAAAMQAKEERTFCTPPSGYVPITPSEVEIEYEIIPDRDLNGAGLLYFANYPMFLDIAERGLLQRAGEFTLDDDMINRRTLVHRKSAYLSNATADDRLKIKLRAWIENPFLIGHGDPKTAPIRLLFNYEMYRESDQRLMMISTSRKVIFGHALGETGLMGVLKNAAARGVK